MQGSLFCIASAKEDYWTERRQRKIPTVIERAIHSMAYSERLVQRVGRLRGRESHLNTGGPLLLSAGCRLKTENRRVRPFLWSTIGGWGKWGGLESSYGAWGQGLWGLRSCLWMPSVRSLLCTQCWAQYCPWSPYLTLPHHNPLEGDHYPCFTQEELEAHRSLNRQFPKCNAQIYASHSAVRDWEMVFGKLSVLREVVCPFYLIINILHKTARSFSQELWKKSYEDKFLSVNKWIFKSLE